MSDVTTRYGIVQPSADRSDAADVPYYIRQAVTAIEKSVMFGQGTFAARPAFGITGRIYVATDQVPKQVYYDYGTGWFQVGALADGAVGTLQLADGAVTAVKMADGTIVAAKIADGTITGVKVADSAITFAKLAAALKPSQGAGGAAEALRALGTAAGLAAAGTHAAQHGPNGADPLILPLAVGGWAAQNQNPGGVFGVGSLASALQPTVLVGAAPVLSGAGGEIVRPQVPGYYRWTMQVAFQTPNMYCEIRKSSNAEIIGISQGGPNTVWASAVSYPILMNGSTDGVYFVWGYNGVQNALDAANSKWSYQRLPA